jgi:GNAT superfamily N-acetyltransferase
LIPLVFQPSGAPREDSMPGTIAIRKMTPDLLPDYLAFFDGPAFSDNPEWSGCFCCYYHVDDVGQWESRTAAQNRDLASKLIHEGQFPGFLAYDQDRLVGWCKAAARRKVPALVQWPEYAVEDEKDVGSIVCFVIEKEHRRQGIAGLLLDAACGSFQRAGLKLAEAYPRLGVSDDAGNYHGPLQMYLAHGFTKFRESEAFWIVQKML